MSTVCQNYSGVVINQNVRPASVNDFVTADSSWRYQEFFLPNNYVRGTLSAEQRIPDLSGFQLFCSIASGSAAMASVDYKLDYYLVGSGWVNLVSDTATGASADGSKVWFDIFFKDSVEITSALWNLVSPVRFRFGFVARAGITGVWYSAPNPLANVHNSRAMSADGITPLLRPGDSAPYSFNFRLLSLVADEGIDALNNPYRSVVLQSSTDNISSTDASLAGKSFLSGPQPSRFAVVSNYFDVRPYPSTTKFGQTNLVPNPGFEYGLAPWNAVVGYGGTTVTAVRSTNWSASGTYSARFTSVYTAAGNASFMSGSAGVTQTSEYGIPTAPVKPGTTYTFSFVANLITNTIDPNSSGLRVDFVDGSGNRLPLPAGLIAVPIQNLGIATYSSTFVVPPGAAGIVVGCTSGSSTAGTYDIYIDNVQLVQTATLPTYADGDSVGWQWTGPPGNSPSVQVLTPTAQDTNVVIDSVLVDPQTPNVYFSVYYSNDNQGNDPQGNAPVTDQGWENKLWTRVPHVYRATKRDQYVLPEPISAKYVKLEFSHLQAQSYNPGDFQKPIAYKKHPKWVSDLFFNLVTNPNNANSNGIVGVVYDALSLAYDYTLDDLNQVPTQPTSSGGSSIGPQANQVDPTTLQKINLGFDTYTQATGLRGSDTLLSSVVNAQLGASASQYPSEQVQSTPSIDPSTVSSLNRDSIVVDQGYPVMYFPIVCRHAYQKLTGTLPHNRAYFVAINEIAFLRNRYTTSSDDTIYIENGGDSVNTERNDFVLDGSNFYVY